MSHAFAATATDNVGVTSLKYYVGATEITSPHTFPVGATEVRCVATDAAGNTATATFTVTVVYEARLRPAEHSDAAGHHASGHHDPRP